MTSTESNRLRAFERMLEFVQENYRLTMEKMQKLKEQGKEKSATYRQLMGNKMQYQNMISLYKLYDLIEEEE